MSQKARKKLSLSLENQDAVDASFEQFQRLYSEIDALLPELYRLRDSPGLQRKSKEALTLQTILNEIAVAGELRQDIARLSDTWMHIKQQNGPDPAAPKTQEQHPESRLHSLRKTIEYKYANCIPPAIAHRIRNWQEDILESCARCTLDEVEGAIRHVVNQKKEWEEQCRHAEFGSPGILSRLKSFFLYLQCKNLEQDIQREKLKVESLRSLFLKHQEWTKAIADLAMCHFKISPARGKKQNSLYEKLVRLEMEQEIQLGIKSRGESLITQGRQIESLNAQKRNYMQEGKSYLRARSLYLNDLGRRYQSTMHENPSHAKEALLHSCFIEATGDLSKLIQMVRGQVHSLRQEMKQQKAALKLSLQPYLRLARSEMRGNIHESASTAKETFHRPD